MKKNSFLLLMLIVSLSVFTNCKEKNRFRLDSNQISIAATVGRFDKSLILLDTISMLNSLQRLEQDYPDFYPLFFEELLAMSLTDSVVLQEQMLAFLTNPEFRKVNADVLEKFNDIAPFENSLSTAYSYIHHYFPAVSLPKVYFFVSGFNQMFLSNPACIGLGVDLYLGRDYHLYEGMSYRYLREKMKPEAMLPDLLCLILYNEFPMPVGRGRFLEQMIYHGKTQFLLSVFIPDGTEEQLLGYSKEQLAWTKKHEAEIWATVVDQKHLFSTDNMLINQYFNDAPFTAPISQDSPGRLGIWLGGQIVKSYMNNNRELSLQDLMNESNSEEILKKSGYRP